MKPNFNDSFFSHSMHQLFNKAGAGVAANENEPPLHKYLRFAGKL